MGRTANARAAACALLVGLVMAFVQAGATASAPLNEPAFRQWLAAFKATALAQGITPEVYDKLTQTLAPDFTLPDLELEGQAGKLTQPEQPEFVKTPKEYLNEAYMGRLAAQGRALLKQHRETLAKIERDFGVKAEILLALWGRETAFGTYKLPHNALRVLATQAYAGRRREMFEREFIGALKMAQEGAIAPADMRSSWAGAMGLIQFLPSDYWKYAVSAEGRRHADIWNSVPDAMTSLANNLKSIGWRPGLPWGFEIVPPTGVDCSLAHLDERKAVGEWLRLGARPTRAVPELSSLEQAPASLLMPAGVFGPSFLTTDNFQIIREYNRSDLYALFVGHLADRIAGGGPFTRGWDGVAQIKSTDVEFLQSRLKTKGLYADTVDGKAGGRTRSALGRYEKAMGLRQTCWPTVELVRTLRQDTAGD